MPPEISLVVCTRDRIDVLRCCVDHLMRASCRGPWQLVLVDNGSSDGTRGWLASLSAKPGMTLDILHEPRPGVARAKNAGLEVATGRIVAFTDDDCYVSASYLDDVLDVFDRDDVGYMGGRLLLHDPEDAPVTIREETEPEWIPAYTFVRAGLLHGANMAFRREVVETVGAFDVLLGPGGPLRSCEDADYQARAAAAGFSGVYAPQPTVRHHHGRRRPEEIDRLFDGYDLGKGAHYLKSLLRRSTMRRTLREWYWTLDVGTRQGRRRLALELLGLTKYAVLSLRSRVRGS